MAPTAKVDPAAWNPEVIRALCQRLPGGRCSVTAKCEVCGSVFNPCLCAASTPARRRRGEGLCAPRVVQVAESRRMRLESERRREHRPRPSGGAGATAFGQLALVKECADLLLKDKQRLVVLGPDDPGESYELGARICSRSGGQYVVRMDGAAPWTQEVDLNKAELELLMNRLDKSLRIQDFAADDGAKVEPLKLAQVEYAGACDAAGDLELVLAPGAPSVSPASTMTSSALQMALPRPFLFVRYVRAGGFAERAGVRPGQILLGFLCQDGDGSASADGEEAADRADAGAELTWRALEPCEDHLPPIFRAGAIRSNTLLGDEAETARQSLKSITLSAEEDFEDHDGGVGWPCRLVFDALPSDWRVTSLDVEGLRAALGRGEGATLTLERAAIDVVNSDHVLRHEHRWERSEQHHRTAKNDEALLKSWTSPTMQLTPAQLQFTFRKLVSKLEAELRVFESERSEHEGLLLRKSWRCLEASNEVTVRESKGNQLQQADKRRALRAAQISFDAHRNELLLICERLPLTFLKDLHDACTYDPDASAVACGDRSGTLLPQAITTASRSGTSSPKRLRSQASLTRSTTGLDVRSMEAQRWESELEELKIADDSDLGDAAHTRQRMLRYLLELARTRPLAYTEPKFLSSPPQSSPPESPSSVQGSAANRRVLSSCQDALTLLGSIIGKYLDNSKARGRKSCELFGAGCAALAPKLSGDYSRPSEFKKDGRMSRAEFENTLLSSGILWLTSDEVRAKFNAMDTDGNGFLTLAEVLKVAGRLVDLMSHSGNA